MEQPVERPIKTRRVAVTDKKTGVKYIEERQYRYDPNKKYNVVISAKRTGMKILKDETEEVRCRPKRKPATEKTTVEASRVRDRALDLIARAGTVSGLEKAVREAYPDEDSSGTADKLLSVAQYLVLTGSTVHNIENFQLEHDLPYAEGMSEDICYNLFEELGVNEQGAQTLFTALANLGKKRGNKSIAFDTTSQSSYSEHLKPHTRQGHNKAGDGLDMYKLVSFYSLDTGLPISFELQTGNISDMASLENAIVRAKSYGLNNPELCLDNGFFSKDNILKLLKGNIRFIIRASLEHEWIYKHLDEADKDGRSLRDTLPDFASKSPNASSIRAVTRREMTAFHWKRERARGDLKAGSDEEQSFRLYYHYYRDEGKASFENAAFENRLTRVRASLLAGRELDEPELTFAKRYFSWRKTRGNKIHITPKEDAIADARKDFGIFVLLSNHQRDPWDALERYRRRNEIERSYKVIKSELDGRHPRVWDWTKVRGKELCRHIALGYKFALYRLLERTRAEASKRADDDQLSKADKKLYAKLSAWIEEQTLEQILSWFDCVENVTVKNSKAKYRWSTEITKRDQAFLDLFHAQKYWI